MGTSERDTYIYIVGETDKETDRDAFILQIDPESGDLINSKIFGGSSYDHTKGVVTDPYGNIHITGYTLSRDLPVTDDAYQKTNKGG